MTRGCGSRWSAAGYGLTQTLAAAPQLVARWEDAQTADPYAWAVLTAALDAARLGARAPLSADFLRAAAPGYCTSQQQAEAPGNWFEQALAYATGKLHGAAAALSPAGAGMGQVAGYTVADYLVQHASRERRYARVPASTWDAVLSHIRDPADAARLADSARSRLLYRYAIPLYRHAADAGDQAAAWQLAELLAGRGDLEATAARPGRRRRPGRRLRGWPSCWPSAATWTSCAPGPTPATGMPPGGWPTCWPGAATWRSCCAPGPTPATDAAGGWPTLAGRGDLDGLRARADAGDRDAACAAGRPAGRARRPGRAARPGRRRRRARRLAAGRAAGRARRPGRGRADLRARGRRRRRARRLAAGRAAGRARRPGRGCADLRARADAGDRSAAWRLAELLAERGDLDGAAQICAPGPTPATEDAAQRLAELLAGSAATWTGCAPGPTPATGTPPGRLAELLAERGDLDGLRARADAGDESAAGSWPICWPSAATWTGCAPGPTPATSYAAWRLAELLAERGDLDGLRARADAGDRDAASQLADLLVRQGRGEEAERLRRFGLNPDGSIACA